jgi:hypothetical protein
VQLDVPDGVSIVSAFGPSGTSYELKKDGDAQSRSYGQPLSTRATRQCSPSSLVIRKPATRLWGRSINGTRTVRSASGGGRQDPVGPLLLRNCYRRNRK